MARFQGSHIRKSDPRLSLSAIKDGLLELAWPTRCVCCDKPGELLCEECYRKLPRINHEYACSICSAPYGRVVCTECWNGQTKNEFPFNKCVAAMSFDEISSRLITSFKDFGERRIAKIIARIMREAIENSNEGWVKVTKDTEDIKDKKDSGNIKEIDFLTYVPASEDALRRRGFDHMNLISKELARQLNVPCIGLLKNEAKLDQRNLSKEQRKQNLQGSFRYMEARIDVAAASISASSSDKSSCSFEVRENRILLVDDVFTTGATLSAATNCLHEAGFKDVDVAVAYRVW